MSLESDVAEARRLKEEVAVGQQQVEFLRKKLNDVLRGAAITSQDDVPAPLLCAMADSMIDFLYRGDPEIDARMKYPQKRWFVKIHYARHGPLSGRYVTRIVTEEHPLLWESKRKSLTGLWVSVEQFWEIPAHVYETVKDRYSTSEFETHEQSSLRRDQGEGDAHQDPVADLRPPLS